MNYQFLAPIIDTDPYGGFSGYATVQSFEEGEFSGREEMTCPVDDGDITFEEECRRIRKLREKDPTIQPIVVRLLNGDLEERRETI